MIETTVRELLTVPEVARRLGQSRQTVYRKISDGEISAVRIGLGPNAPLRVPSAELELFIFGANPKDTHATN